MKLSAKIGAIEFTGDEVRVAIVKTGGKLPRVLELHVVRAVYGDEPDERREALAAAAAEALGRVKSRPALYVLCAPSSASITRQLTIPFRGKSRVAAAVQYELEPFLAFPIDDLVVDHLTVREIEGETQVLCVALQRNLLEEQLDILNTIGVAVEGIGLDSVGLTSLWHSLHGTTSGLHAVLHVREEGAVAAIVQGKRLVYLRHLPVPLERFHETPKSAAREVQNILRAFSASWGTDTQLEGLSITGLDLDHEQRATFEADFTIPIHYKALIDSLQGATQASGKNGLPEGLAERSIEQRWAAVVGVANAGAGGAYNLDFLTSTLAPTANRRGIVGHLAFTALLAFLALVSYAGYATLVYRSNQAEIERIGQRVYEEFKATYPNAESAQQRPANDIGGILSLQRLQEEAERESQVTAALSMDMFTKPTLLEILKALAVTMPDNRVGIQNLRLTLVKNQDVTIDGEVKDTAAFQEIINALESSPVIEVNPNHQRQSLGGRETFRITATQ